jgi:hypothetical protein
MNPTGRTARGYGYTHQQLRVDWAKKVEAGQVCCARCGFWIAPGSEWHLGHDDWDRSKYNGPEHARCNIGGANRKRRKRPRPAPSWRSWL